MGRRLTATLRWHRVHHRLLSRRGLKIVEIDVLSVHLTQVQSPDDFYARALVRFWPHWLDGAHEGDVVAGPSGRLVAEGV